MGHHQADAAAGNVLTLPGPVWLLAVLAFALAAGMAELARRYALSRALLDLPGPRRSHALPTPRGGGLGIAVSVLILIPPLSVALGIGSMQLLPLMLALALVAGVGAIDDHRPLPPWPRLVVHLTAAVIIAGWLVGAPNDLIPALGFALVVVSVVSAINIWNFMDGIDSLAASQAAVIFLGLAVLPGLAPEQELWRGISLVLAASTLGFLIFNLPPARLFLGDVGSGALGLLLAALLATLVIRGRMDWQVALIVPSAFLADAGLTLTGRIVRGEPWWQPHRLHLYQWAVQSGKSHGATSICYLVWTAAVMVLAAWAAPRGGSGLGITLFGVYTFAAIIWFLLSRRFRDQARRHNA